MSTTGQLLVTVLVCSLLLVTVNAKGLRSNIEPDNERSLDDCLACHVTYLGVRYEEGGEDEILQCMTEQGKGYNLALPTDVYDEHEEDIMNGEFNICISGGIALEYDDGQMPDVFIPEGAEITVMEGLPWRNRRLETSGRAEGIHDILVVRLSHGNEKVQPSKTDLAGSVFGLGSKAMENNVVSQYERCSFDKLQYRPATGNSKIQNGVIDVELDKKFQGADVVAMLNHMEEKTEKALGFSPGSMPYRHRMYCVPPGTKFFGSSSWIAFAYIGGEGTFFNDKWCNFLSAQMHEIGHNWGFHHSNEDGIEYDDRTGIMGFSYQQTNGPLMCFNPFKNWLFEWYQDKSLKVDPVKLGRAWVGKLAAFVHYDNADRSAGEYIVAKVDNLYIQFNGATSFNKGTVEKRNKVIIVEGKGTREFTHLRAGLGRNQSYNGPNNIVVEVCDIERNTGYLDYAKVSIHTRTQASGC